MQINPGLSLVQINKDTVQVGSGARSVLVNQCTPAIINLISRLSVGVSDGEEQHLGTTWDIPQQQVQNLINLLEPVLVPYPDTTSQSVHTQHEHQYEDVAAAQALLTTPEDPSLNTILAQRNMATIQVLGLGRTGTALALCLAESGIGHLVLSDPHITTKQDLGTGLAVHDVGRLRPVAVERAINNSLSTTSTFVFPQANPSCSGDLTVCITRGALDPDFLVRARVAGQHVLTAVLRDDDVLIGPWMVPDAAPCPRCREQNDHQQAAALLMHQSGNEPLSLAAAVAGLLAQQVLNWVDGREKNPITNPGVMIRVDAATGTAHSWNCAPDPRCECALTLEKETHKKPTGEQDGGASWGSSEDTQPHSAKTTFQPEEAMSASTSAP